MTKSDSLDNITLDSDDIRTIERFENNYYNRKNNIIQNGGGGAGSNEKNHILNQINPVHAVLSQIPKVGPIEIPTTASASAPTLPSRPSRPSQQNNNKNASGGNNKKDKLEKNIKRLYNCYILSQNLNGGNNNELSFQIKKRLDNKIAQLAKELEGGEVVATVLITGAIIEGINRAVIEYIKSQINNITTEETTKTIVQQLIKTMNIRNIVIDTISSYTNKAKDLCGSIADGARCMFNIPDDNIQNLKAIKNELKGGEVVATVLITGVIIEGINGAVIEYIKSQINNITTEKTTKTIVQQLIKTMNIRNIVIDTISSYTNRAAKDLCGSIADGARCMLNIPSNIQNLKSIKMEFAPLPQHEIPHFAAKRK